MKNGKNIHNKTKLSKNKQFLLIAYLLIISLNSCNYEPKILRVDTNKNNYDNYESKILRADPNRDSSYFSEIEKKSVPDKKKFDFDPSKPFRLEFGRGSGWTGLNTIKIEENGSVAVHMLREEKIKGVIYSYCENGLLKLSEKDLRIITDKIVELEILDMDMSYYAEGIRDGTQWIFWVQQGKEQKSIHFSNHFPKKILYISVIIDEILENAGYNVIKWKRFPNRETLFHQIDIWNSIR